MGCDIHLHIEKRDENGKWVQFDWEAPFAEGTYDDGSRKLNYGKYFESPFYVGRNYDLFAILADVRNGRGFAACDTGDGFNPISEARGLPEDVSPEIRQESDDWGIDGHSHSWFTVAELLAYDWNQTTKHRGTVDAWNFEVFRKKGKPNSWSGGVSGMNVEHVSNQHLAKLIDSGDLQWEGDEPPENSWNGRPYTTSTTRSFRAAGIGTVPGSLGEEICRGKSLYTIVEWEETYAESVKHFLETVVPALQELGEPESVRIVFWFDN